MPPKPAFPDRGPLRGQRAGPIRPQRSGPRRLAFLRFGVIGSSSPPFSVSKSGPQAHSCLEFGSPPPPLSFRSRNLGPQSHPLLRPRILCPRPCPPPDPTVGAPRPSCLRPRSHSTELLLFASVPRDSSSPSLKSFLSAPQTFLTQTQGSSVELGHRRRRSRRRGFPVKSLQIPVPSRQLKYRGLLLWVRISR